MIDFLPSREVVITLGSWSVRWYGLLYVVAFWQTWYFLPRLQKYRALTLARDQWTYILSWAAVGVIAGGRLGYILFYHPYHYWQHPLEIFYLWQGGMSSHGGFIGVGVAVWLACRKLKIDWLAVLDVATVPAAIGLTLGRIGNFINQELYTNHIYPIGKDFFITLICLYSLRKNRHPGRVTAIFLTSYSVLRVATEYFRDDYLGVGITAGQILTLPLLAAGGYLWWQSGK